MKLVCHLLDSKGREVLSIAPHASVLEAISLMAEKSIGALVVMDGDKLGPVQQAFAEEDAFQCGFCTPGQIMSVEGMLRSNPNPTLNQIRTGVSGNLCRCGSYKNIFNAAAKAANLRKQKGGV